jgi:hypothetical protein
MSGLLRPKPDDVSDFLPLTGQKQKGTFQTTVCRLYFSLPLSFAAGINVLNASTKP